MRSHYLAISIPIDTAMMLAKKRWNGLDHIDLVDRAKKEPESLVDIIVSQAPYYILHYGGKLLNYADMLPDSKLKIILLTAGKAISALAGYWNLKEKSVL